MMVHLEIIQEILLDSKVKLQKVSNYIQNPNLNVALQEEDMMIMIQMKVKIDVAERSYYL